MTLNRVERWRASHEEPGETKPAEETAKFWSRGQLGRRVNGGWQKTEPQMSQNGTRTPSGGNLQAGDIKCDCHSKVHGSCTDHVIDHRAGLWRRLSTEELMLLNCGVGEDSWESLRLQEDPTSPFWRRSALGFLWKEWCWSWNSSTLATSCEELTHWKRLWC